MHQHRSRHGTYILQADSAKVNGKEFWIQDGDDNERNAIWFDKEYNHWNIGSLEYIGTNRCGFCSANNASELDKVTSWEYFKGDEWFPAPINDMQIRGMYLLRQCTALIITY